MRHLKLFENWTYDKLYKRQQQEISIKNAIRNFCIIKEEIEEDWYVNRYNFLNDGKLFVLAKDTNVISHHIILDGEEFVEYFNDPDSYDPELYKNKNKFNL